MLHAFFFSALYIDQLFNGVKKQLFEYLPKARRREITYFSAKSTICVHHGLITLQMESFIIFCSNLS